MIVFKDHWQINYKLCWPTFYYPKFNVISNFVQYIWDYGSFINYNIANSKTMQKYFFKAFYNMIKKKEYNL